MRKATVWLLLLHTAQKCLRKKYLGLGALLRTHVRHIYLGVGLQIQACEGMGPCLLAALGALQSNVCFTLIHSVKLYERPEKRTHA